MRKTNTQLNLDSHETNGQNTTESPSFSMNNRETYLKLINTLNGLTIFKNNPKYNIFQLASQLLDKNEILYEEYSNKYIEAIYEINESYDLFKSSIELNNETLVKQIEDLDTFLQTQYNDINDDCLKYQQEAISRYKEQENIFLHKTKNLTLNKQINKDELYNKMLIINKKRISSNQNYNNIANDLSSINEQEQLKFKHSLESSVEKYNYDNSVINEDYNEKIIDLDEEIKEFENKQRQLIQSKEREIIDNSIQLNNIITQLGIEFSNRLKYAFIPYDIKSNKFLDELSENEKTYNSIEEQVLSEFKTMLQKNDDEIEILREEHKRFVDEYLSQLKMLKISYNNIIQKEVTAINRKIAGATSNQSSSTKKEINEIIKKLVIEKKEFLKKHKKEKEDKIKKLKENYLLYELNYIERYEQLRSKKSECEAIKSSAMKNINYERVYHHERINSEIRLINSEKESFSTQDHYEEIKEIYNNRMNFEIENEKVKYIINEIELDIYIEKILNKYKKDKITAERDYSASLCKVDLEYQEETIKTRIDYFNVKTMLDIKKESIINEFEKLYAAENIAYEEIKHTFYNTCDNIQYEIYKNNNSLVFKLIDEDVKLQQELSEIEKNHRKALNQLEKNRLKNENNYQENLLRVKLYEDRLEIEKSMISNLYENHLILMKNVCDFEFILHDLISKITFEEFNKNKKEIMISLELIRQIKLDILKNYLNKEVLIINTRLNFEKGIKFNIQIENAKKGLDDSLKNLQVKFEKNEQLITSHRNTILLSFETIRKYKTEILKLNKELIKNRFKKDKSRNIIKQIKEYKENISLIEKQIKANKTNLKKLNILKFQQKEEKLQKEKMYNLRIDKIKRTQANEEKIYNYIIKMIEKQYNSIKNEILTCGQIVSIFKYNYEFVEVAKAKISDINNEILYLFENYFDLHMAKFIELFERQSEFQKDIYTKNYDRYCKDLKNSTEIERKEYQTSITTATNAYTSVIDTMKRHSKIIESKLLAELKKANEQFLENMQIHKEKMNKITEQKNYELQCHEDNYQMYLSIYNDKNATYIKNYVAKIKEIKNNYKQVLDKLEIKYKHSLKKLKAQHISNITLNKNNISIITLEYKENIKKTNNKIKKNSQNEKRIKVTHDENKKISYKLYVLNQRNTRKEFEIQTKQIIKKANTRIKLLKKTFIKDFKNKRD